jgi:GNAT superfamily N-acetyltransferase
VSLAIREATRDDLELCLTMDGDGTADHVWQITQREQPHQIQVILNGVRLPRPMPIEYPRSAPEILDQWKQIDTVLVAEEGDYLAGFVDGLRESWHGLAVVRNLVVTPAARRRGVGTALIGGINHWAHSMGLHALVVEAGSQNWPAICFYQKLGFSFSGLSDRHYRDRIALFFARGVK